MSNITRPSTRLDNLLLLAVQSFSESRSRILYSVVCTQTTIDKFGKKLNITLNDFQLLYITVFRDFDKSLILAEILTFNPAILDYYKLLLLLLLSLLLLLLYIIVIIVVITACMKFKHIQFYLAITTILIHKKDNLFQVRIIGLVLILKSAHFLTLREQER